MYLGLFNFFDKYIAFPTAYFLFFSGSWWKNICSQSVRTKCIHESQMHFPGLKKVLFKDCILCESIYKTISKIQNFGNEEI